MTLIARYSTVKCDKCLNMITLAHQLEYEADSGYAFNLAIDLSHWKEAWLDDVRGYGHLCPICYRVRLEKQQIIAQHKKNKLAKNKKRHKK